MNKDNVIDSKNPEQFKEKFHRIWLASGKDEARSHVDDFIKI